MSENTQLLSELEKLLAWKKSKVFYAEKLGISVEEVGQLLSELRGNKHSSNEVEVGNYISELEDVVATLSSEKVNEDGTREISYRSSKPLQREEIESLYGVDNISTKLSSYWNKELPSGRYLTSALIKCLKDDFSIDKFQEFLSSYTPKSIECVSKEFEASKKEIVDVVVSIADFHLDRLTTKKDDLDVKSKEYIKIVKSLVLKASASFYINRLIFVIGNDFFNSDNYQGTTTSGTPQDNIASFSESYEKGFSTLVESIFSIEQLADVVDVILVQGNHDRTKSYYLAHALEAYFKSSPNINFDRAHSTTKYTVSGDTFIGFHHGNTKIDELPLLFATSSDSSADFGYRKYREILTADKHHYMAKEIKGVRIQQMPSLSNPSRWESDNNFLNNIRAGLAIVYHPTKGRVAEFEERL